jgi:hypothetical protein
MRCYRLGNLQRISSEIHLHVVKPPLGAGHGMGPAAPVFTGDLQAALFGSLAKIRALG